MVGWRGLDDAVVSDVDGALCHSGVNVVFHMKVHAGEDVHNDAGDYKTREVESGRASGE